MRKTVSLFLILLLFVSMISAVSAGDVQAEDALPVTAMPGDAPAGSPEGKAEYFEFTCFREEYEDIIFVPAFKTFQLTWKTNITDPIIFRSSDPSIIEVDQNGLLTSKKLAPWEEVSIKVYARRSNTVDLVYSTLITYSMFTDVCDPDAFFFYPVYFAYTYGITSGFTDSHGDPTGYFKPNDKCTRAQIVTFMYRAYAEYYPADTSGVKDFKDVKKDTYYYDAVKWAVAAGITTGYTDKNGKPTGKFGPDDICNRAQVVTFLWRLMGDIWGEGPNVQSFSDVKKGTYYYDAVRWAVSNNITSGYTDSNGNPTGKFGPDDKCTRGQVVTFLYRTFA